MTSSRPGRASAGSIVLPPGGPTPLRSTRQHNPEAIRTWLAGAHPVPSTARQEWAHHRIALLPLGRRFGAVRIPGTLVHAEAGSSDRQVVAATLVENLNGPVIHDYRSVGPAYYALVSWHPDLQWTGREDTPYLGPESYLGVPDVDRTTPPDSYWVVAPRHQGDLCRLAPVTDFIVRARRLARAQEGDRDGEE